MSNSAFSCPKLTNDETKWMRHCKEMPHQYSSFSLILRLTHISPPIDRFHVSLILRLTPISLTKADYPTVLFFNSTLTTHPKTVSFTTFSNTLQKL